MGYGGWMANAQNIKVNGTELGDIATITESKAPLMRVPKRRGSNITVPGRSGAVLTPNKPYDVNTFVLPLLVRGSASDGTIPFGSTPEQEFYARVAQLIGLFRRGDTITLDTTMPDGTVRRAECEVVDVIDVDRHLGDRPIAGKVNVALSILDPFWSSLSTVTNAAAGAGLTTGQFLTLSNFATATAPLTGLTLTFGPGNNPTLIQGAAFFAYDGVIASGKQLVVDCSTWTLSTGSGSAWTPDYSKVRYSPGPAWFVVDPNQSPLQVALSHTTGAGVQMPLTVTGLLKFLNA